MVFSVSFGWLELFFENETLAGQFLSYILWELRDSFTIVFFKVLEQDGQNNLNVTK